MSGGSPVPNPVGAGGRHRAASIHLLPSSPSPYTKFDPSVDDNFIPPCYRALPDNLVLSKLTIHIPPAAPTELKWHSTSPNRRIPGSGSPFLGGWSRSPHFESFQDRSWDLTQPCTFRWEAMRCRLPSFSGPGQYVKSGLVPMEA